MVGKTDECGNKVLDLPDEEEGYVPYSKPELVYFPSMGNFQIQGIRVSGYTNITKRQARQMVEFINQVLGRESMTATREDKEAWEARYKLNEAEKRFSEAIELVNESMIHYEHVRNNTMTQACDVLEGLFTPLAEKFAAARRKALEEEA